MLMALTRPSRSIDLAGLNTKCLKYSPEGVTFIPTELAKQSRQTKKIAEFSFPVFPANDRLCPVTTLRAYQERPRDRHKDKEHSQLFISPPSLDGSNLSLPNQELTQVCSRPTPFVVPVLLQLLMQE